MVEVTGKTIDELEQKTSLEGNYKFLGCSGTGLTYSTWTTTYDTIMHDISAGIYAHIPSDLQGQIDEIKNTLAGGGQFFNKDRTASPQTVSSTVNFINAISCGNSIQCARHQIDTSQPYFIKLPRDTYRSPSGNNESYTNNDDSRIVIKKEVQDLIDGLRQEITGYEQILNMGYAAYQTNGVKVLPVYTNKNYENIYSGSTQASGDELHKFYRYGGIRSIPTFTEREAAGTVFKQTSGYSGLPLTKSYRQFRNLTIVCIGDSSPTSGVGSAQKIYSVTIPTQSIDIAYNYKLYKTQFKKTRDRTEFYFDGINDKWYFNDYSGEIVYLDTKPSTYFTETFLPIRFKTNGFCAAAVFGQK